MSEPTGAGVAIDRRRPSDDDELFELYARVFGTELTRSSRDRWRWQYLDNPHNVDGPEIWVAREAGRLLGQYASMPVRLWWGDAEVRSSWGMDVFLNADARGRGLGARLFTAWSDHVEVALGLGLTPSSYGLFKKLRYHDVGPVPFFQKVLDPVAVARRRLGTALGTLVGRAWALRPQRRAPVPDPELELEPITGFSADYDTLWQEARAGYAMCVRRDAAYLNWKYVACPTREYDLLEARRDGRLAGYAVSRHGPHRGVRLGWLVDVFARAGDDATRDALVGEVLRRFAAAGVGRAQAFAMNAALGDSLRRRGFWSAPSPMQFCVRSRVADNGALQRPAAWHVVFGDSDMDR